MKVKIKNSGVVGTLRNYSIQPITKTQCAVVIPDDPYYGGDYQLKTDEKIVLVVLRDEVEELQ